MGLVLQMQRRALESAIGASYIPIASDKKYRIGNDEIFFWGVSQGYGTCSDIHGLDIAVFGFEESTTPIQIDRVLYFAAVDMSICGPERVVKCIAPKVTTQESVVFDYTGIEIPYVKL